MAKVFLIATAFSGLLLVSGCLGALPGAGGYGYGGDQYYDGTQAYDPGGGAYYASQTYSESQPYGYAGNTAGYAYQPGTGGCAGAPPGRWLDRRRQYQEERIRRGMASGQLAPQEARRLQRDPARFRGAEGRTRPGPNSQDIYQARHNARQIGPAVQMRPPAPARPQMQARPAPPPRTTTSTRTTSQRSSSQRRHDR